MSNWRLACAAVAGVSHNDQGVPCQDKVIARSDKTADMIALADGAGSAKLSHFGADRVLDGVSRLFFDEPELFFRSPKQEVKELVATTISNELEGLSRDLSCDLYDLSSTFLFFATLHNRYVSFHIGDGVIGVMNGLEPTVLSHPYNGRYASITRFTTDPELMDALRMRRGDASKISAAILMSDGSSTSLYKETEGELVKAVLKLFVACKENDETTMNRLLEETIEDQLTQKTGDDCSIALMARDKSKLNRAYNRTYSRSI